MMQKSYILYVCACKSLLASHDSSVVKIKLQKEYFIVDLFTLGWLFDSSENPLCNLIREL